MGTLGADRLWLVGFQTSELQAGAQTKLRDSGGWATEAHILVLRAWQRLEQDRFAKYDKEQDARAAVTMGVMADSPFRNRGVSCRQDQLEQEAIDRTCLHQREVEEAAAKVSHRSSMLVLSGNVACSVGSYPGGRNGSNAGGPPALPSSRKADSSTLVAPKKAFFSRGSSKKKVHSRCHGQCESVFL